MNLQTAILALAPRHRATSRVPVLGSGNAVQEIAFDADGAMLVWDGASEATIYGDARVNHAFRAWHDAQHIAAGAGFTLDDERPACELQVHNKLTCTSNWQVAARKNYGIHGALKFQRTGAVL